MTAPSDSLGPLPPPPPAPWQLAQRRLYTSRPIASSGSTSPPGPSGTSGGVPAHAHKTVATPKTKIIIHRTQDSSGGGSDAGNDTEQMGMDPTRPHQRRPADYLFVGATIVAGILLVLWVLFGSA